MPPASRPPILTTASWVAPIVFGLITYFVSHQAEVAGRARGEWLPGIWQLFIGIFIAALSAFSCGLAALLRHERHRWLAILPFLAGLSVFLFAAWQKLH